MLFNDETKETLQHKIYEFAKSGKILAKYFNYSVCLFVCKYVCLFVTSKSFNFEVCWSGGLFVYL